MKPNFHAIGAIVYGLRFGITGIPVFLKRGWLGVLVALGASFGLFSSLMADAHFETLQGNMGFGGFAPVTEVFAEMADDWGGDAEWSGEWDGADAEEIGEALGFVLMMLLSLILSIPGIVDVYRKSAGMETRGGFLPVFGAPEWSLFFSAIVFFLATLVFYAVVALPVIGLLVFAGINEQPALMIIPMAIAFVAVVWWLVRAQLIPIHSALVGEIAFMDGFNLTGGRFWKLLGTSILLAVVLIIVEFAAGILSLSLALQDFIDLSLAVNVLLYGYLALVRFAAYGRITGDLMGLVDEEDADPNYGAADELEEEAEDFFEEATEGVTGEEVSYTAADHWTAPQAQDSAAPTRMMRRAGEPTTQFTTAAEPAQAPQEPVEAPAPRKADRPSVQFVRRRFRS